MKVDRSNKKKIKRAKIVKRHLKGMKKNHTHNNNNKSLIALGEIVYIDHTTPLTSIKGQIYRDTTSSPIYKK